MSGGDLPTTVDYEYRKDGWPLCPECGEDELWSTRSFDEPPDPSHPMRCYNCAFEGKVPLMEKQP
jgi:predicted RNA-binding Zn-ribbon protein involved in translation (DUF1610 family)